MAIAVWTSFEQITNSNGVPHTSVQVNVYAAGTVTKLDVFSNSGLSTPADNPIECDAFGQHSIRYIAAASYKTVVTALVNSVRVTLNEWSKDNIDPGVPLGSGALAIANGGTSATSASGALAALGAATAAEVADLAADVASLAGAAASTEKTHIATGTTAQRPSSPIEGDIRRNTTTAKYENYIAAWDNFMLESGNAASTAAIAAETAEATFIRPDRAKHHQGVAKAWAYVTNPAGTPTLVDSYNVTSITDNGTGDITVNLSITMANANFAAIATSISSSIPSAVVTAKTTTTVRVVTVNTSAAAADAGFSVVIHGDI